MSARMLPIGSTHDRAADAVFVGSTCRELDNFLSCRRSYPQIRKLQKRTDSNRGMRQDLRQFVKMPVNKLLGREKER